MPSRVWDRRAATLVMRGSLPECSRRPVGLWQIWVVIRTLATRSAPMKALTPKPTIGTVVCPSGSGPKAIPAGWKPIWIPHVSPTYSVSIAGRRAGKRGRVAMLWSGAADPTQPRHCQGDATQQQSAPGDSGTIRISGRVASRLSTPARPRLNLPDRNSFDRWKVPGGPSATFLLDYATKVISPLETVIDGNGRPHAAMNSMIVLGRLPARGALNALQRRANSRNEARVWIRIGAGE